MLATQRPRRTREYTGPTPHSVAIRAKMPSKTPPDHLILERRRHDDAREEAVAVTKYNALCDLKNDWERITDRRIQLNTVRRKVKGLMLEEEFTLEDRKEKLRELLVAEEAKYLEEMEASQETVLERQAKMRERAKYLKEKREKERLGVVAEKLDQRWREECEELRFTLSRRHMDEVCMERGDQLRIKAEIDQQSQAEEQMYAEMWHQDMLAKAAREEREARERHARNRETLETLQVQKAALEAKRLEAKRLKEEEGRLLAEERELRKMEEQRAHQEKLAKQQQTRDDIATNIRLKTKRRAKEMQEELALDMSILEKLLSDSRNEAMDIAQRKKELREEDQRYRAYLKQQAFEDEERDREIDKLIDAEVQRQWQKRLDEWARQREARRKLMDSVLAIRRQQVQEKLAANAKAQESLQKERDLMQAAMEEHQRLEDEKQTNIHRDNLVHQEALLGQMDYSRRQHEVQRDEDHREYLKGMEAEAEYQAKLKAALERPVIDKMHPMRRAHMAKRVSSAPQRDELF